MAKGKGNGMMRLKGILAFFIGIFGALAILGVYFKIAKIGNYELFMKAGFLGEAGAFVVMGLLELIGSVFGFSGESESDTPVAALSADALPSNFAQAVDAKLDARLDEMLVHFAGDIDRFRSEMNALAGEMSHSRAAVGGMRTQLESVSTSDLAGDADRLGQGMAILGTEMAGAGQAVESMRSDLEMMAQRFRHFNYGNSANGTQDHAPLGRAKRTA